MTPKQIHLNARRSITLGEEIITLIKRNNANGCEVLFALVNLANCDGNLAGDGQSALDRSAHPDGAKWISKFASALTKYCKQHQQRRLRSLNLSRSQIGAPVLKAWQNLTPDPQGGIAAIPKENGSAPDLVGTVGELPEHELEPVARKRPEAMFDD